MGSMCWTFTQVLAWTRGIRVLEGAEPQEVPAALRTAAVTRRTTGGPCWGAYLRVLLQNEPSSVRWAPCLASVGRRMCQTLAGGRTQTLPNFFNIATGSRFQAHLCPVELPLVWYQWEAGCWVRSEYQLASLRKVIISVWVCGINCTANWNKPSKKNNNKNCQRALDSLLPIKSHLASAFM